VKLAATFTAAIVSALCCLFSLQAFAESPGEAMKRFGLVGTWSDNCALMSAWTTFDISDSGAATFTSVGPMTAPGVFAKIISTLQIDQATVLSDDKIMLVAWTSNVTRTDGKPLPPWDRSPHNMIVQSDAAGMRVIDNRTVDGTRVDVENGIQRFTGKPLQLRHRCQAP
jgi:hypothetical protein